MKIEIDDNSLIDEIVKRVVVQLIPILNNSHNSVDDELMDVKELAKYLKVKESWVYEKTHTRQIPFQKAGRFPRFRKKNIDKWLGNSYSAASRAYKPLKKEGGGI